MWHTSAIPKLGRWRQHDQEFQCHSQLSLQCEFVVNLSYMRPCLVETPAKYYWVDFPSIFCFRVRLWKLMNLVLHRIILRCQYCHLLHIIDFDINQVDTEKMTIAIRHQCHNLSVIIWFCKGLLISTYDFFLFHWFTMYSLKKKNYGSPFLRMNIIAQ